MDNGEIAPPAAKRREKSPYIPHELVREILVRLPVDSLMRFTCVCKAWGSTISGDASFHRAHLRLQRPCMLLSPFAGFNHDDHGRKRKVAFYRWEASQRTEDAPLVYSTEVPSARTKHKVVHCDGLVLVPAGDTVLLLNPATRRVRTLPRSPNVLVYSHQVFGLGRDPRSNTYKVARFFYRSAHVATSQYHYATVTGDYQYTVEVFTLGVDRQWRETAARPPYPAKQWRHATSFKGSLLWTVDERAIRNAAPGFLRFNLADETFGITPLPPCCPSSQHATMGLAELRGELLAAQVHNDVEMWVCNNVDNPNWELHHKIVLSKWGHHLNPIGVFDDNIVFLNENGHLLIRYDRQTKSVKCFVRVIDLRYYNPSTGAIEYVSSMSAETRQSTTLPYELPLSIFTIDVIPYVPSIIPI
ncbi:hypothetical protein QYE76_057663 [Lolium multiflorum]|uniref:F-box domain-containing protein n=1 Tax=Lolium multiflorum TaxID=4521 RepID=A0AAD8WP04_LOLMU|nr:hypothetical protein QYE76_057663 [Lolium multiflorum]